MAKDDNTEIMKALSRIMGGICVGIVMGGVIFGMVIYRIDGVEKEIKINRSAIFENKKVGAVLNSRVGRLEQMNYKDE